ncbi:junctional cadherin 5-associated protein [Eublepharis macularius]|uniref:Junctional cadherin 5-associated protein n=1 Tax=Eublepharis macularius TaxID=481883 RepID=A0AA97K1L3_EUBMA|nr:junctional cadherin 5-associated protein [Eublepharis macularius]XP_054847449.1 junctional cadherin 5-associated protein [Eublepharis macularius]XP_054847450.1 junctional cadherin 5-associated protein [Eublepharis macularius]XP_054847451.1 junctional cadherin 5-associated protein [Eublepharis macularius]XP_054847452.1 junctional cadherin 5-associated protein [Eublepharis macularius]XP_054847453.1 junctional cadherin 5-associated protein [Eublepharis macularius]
MFSVEDLLISHGYKLSKNSTSLYENRCDGYQHEGAEKSAHGTLNGFPAKSRAYTCVKKPATKSYLNDNESGYVSQGQQPGYHQDVWSLANTHASEGRFYDQPQLASSHPKTDKDLAYWRRRGQDFSILFGCTETGDSEMKGIAAPRALHGHDKESQWEVGGGTERMRPTGLQENWKTPADYRWQSLRAEAWNPPTKLGRLLSDGDRERLLQDSYSARHGEATVASRNKGKSQSLPRVLSPESLRCIEMPSSVNNHSLSRTKTTSCPQARLAQESSKRLEPTAHFLPLPKPKYGRPLKPPPYELHRQTRGMLEPTLLPDGQQKDEAVSLTKGNEQSQDACAQDSCLEPPVYIPPPCYKSPAQQSIDQYLPSKVPEYDACFNNGLQHPVERAILSYQPSVSNFGTREQHCKDEQIPQDKKRHRKHAESYLSSVQYIPFDDPRIRHIKVAHTDSLQEGASRMRDANRISPCAFQESAQVELEHDSAFLDTSDSFNTAAVKCSQFSDSSVHSSRWLAESNVDQDNSALPIQRNCYDAGNDRSHKYPKSRPLAQSPPTEAPCETVTKIKTFEPGMAVQSRRSSKKKMNETIFCLVSVPVKAELNLPDTDRNNNLTQGADEKNGFDNSRVLQEQSLLSTSSTDLELQALTGNMTHKNELPKQELWRPEFKQMNDLRLLQPAKHKELQYSGSWPGDQYKDQQTQTSFTEEPKLLQLSHSLGPSRSTKGPATQWLRNAVPTTESVTLATLTADDRKRQQDAYRVKGKVDLGPSSSKVCSRTAARAPEACQKNPPCASCASLPGQERETSSVLREEASAACSSKELFGQFLLKPVGRRPWDVISELESFNKELQEQEESSEDGVENEDKQKRGEEKEGTPEGGTCRTEGMSQGGRPTVQLETDMLVAPVFQQVREKSKAEHLSQSESLNAWVIDGLHINARSQSCLQAKEAGESVRPADGYVTAEPRKQEVEERVIKQAMTTPRPIAKILLDSYSDEEHYNPFNGIRFRETAQVKNHRDDEVDFDRIKNNTVPWNNLALERGSGVCLSLSDRNHGLSEPDLRSVGLESGHAPGTEQLDCYGEGEVTEIPPNESLQARAARILGIEVAVESLVSDSSALQDEHFHSDNTPESLELSAERALGSKREAEVTSSEGRRKCGWTESSLFIGDRNVTLRSVENQKSEQEAVLDKPHFEHHKGLYRQGENQTTSLESVVLPFSERNLVHWGAEKKARSTSKVIETLQGKLASPPSRAAVDRLVRMKEVDSVSRMRRLSIKNADSVEDGEEQTKGVEERGSNGSLASNELTRKMSHGSSVSKRIISLAENGLLDNISDRKAGRDLFCLDAYDPTRVERV